MTRDEENSLSLVLLLGLGWFLTKKDKKKTDIDDGAPLPEVETSPINQVTLQGLYWGKVFEPAFAQELVNVANRLGFDPNDLASIIVLERGLDGNKLAKGHYHKYIDSDGTIHEGNFGYGLIGILPGTAVWLGTTPEALYNMTDIEQLAYVEKYFVKHGWNKGGKHDLTQPIPASIDPDKKLTQFDQIYMGVFYGQPGIDAPLYGVILDKEKQPDTYKKHKEMGLDLNDNGKITKKEILTIARKFKKAGQKKAHD